MKIQPRHFIIGLISMVSIASFAGFVSGTIAWYANVTRVTVEYTGTAVSEAEQLQIGLISSTDFTLDEHGDPIPNTGIVDIETIGGLDYYWAAPGVGFSSTAINAYLTTQGHATTDLEPVTTRSYATGGAFKLWRAPIAYRTDFFDAKDKSYCQLNIAFRVLNAAGETVGDKDVWVSDATVQAGNPGEDIREALRIYFLKNGSAASSFVLNPTADRAGTNDVGGILSLSTADDYYDSSEGTEIVYGDYSALPATTHYAVDSGLDDFNLTGAGEASTFLGKHRAGVDGYDSSDREDFVPLTTAYRSLSEVAPYDDNGSLSGGVPIAHTDPSSKVGNVEMTIYLEGWDHSVINKEIGNGFNLGLQFQIDRV